MFFTHTYFPTANPTFEKEISHHSKTNSPFLLHWYGSVSPYKSGEILMTYFISCQVQLCRLFSFLSFFAVSTSDCTGFLFCFSLSLFATVYSGCWYYFFCQWVPIIYYSLAKAVFSLSGVTSQKKKIRWVWSMSNTIQW